LSIGIFVAAFILFSGFSMIPLSEAVREFCEKGG